MPLLHFVMRWEGPAPRQLKTLWLGLRHSKAMLEQESQGQTYLQLTAMELLTPVLLPRWSKFVVTIISLMHPFAAELAHHWLNISALLSVGSGHRLLRQLHNSWRFLPIWNCWYVTLFDCFAHLGALHKGFALTFHLCLQVTLMWPRSQHHQQRHAVAELSAWPLCLLYLLLAWLLQFLHCRCTCSRSKNRFLAKWKCEVLLVCVYVDDVVTEMPKLPTRRSDTLCN